MVARLAHITLDAIDVQRLAAFWSEVLALDIERRTDGSIKLRPTGDTPRGTPPLRLQPVQAERKEKLRLHLDLRPAWGDVEGEVAWLVALGASQVEGGQSERESFTVMADPEGNGFCLLHVDG